MLANKHNYISDILTHSFPKLFSGSPGIYIDTLRPTQNDQNRTNLYSAKMSTICGKERIQHDLTNCLDPSLRLNRYHGDPGNNEFICILYSNQ